jgi:trimethylamine--corrinoid protein Co-methyltransferase
MAKSNLSQGASQAPHYRPLAPQYLDRIDRTGRRILERVGIRITDTSFLQRLEAAGAQVDYATGRARFQPDWLDEALARAPSSFTLYSRDGRNDLTLGEGNVYFGNGGRVFRILDMATGGYRLSLLRDVAHTAALVDKLDHIRFYIIACQAHDIKPKNYHLLDFYHAFNHTTKHVMGGCDDLHGVQQMHRLASIIAGGEDRLREKPFVSVITNPISPLTIDSSTLAILDFCASHGIPATCAPAPMAGATSPGTLAGTLSQMHAEALAGIAIAQAFAPGAKVLYGAFATSMDYRDMELATGSVETGMMNAAAAQLAALYGLPMYGSGGLTEAKRPDVQAGFEKAMSSLTVAMTDGADLVHLAAGMLDSGNSVSYEQYVIDNEIIGMIQRLLKGITVNEDTLGFDVVEQVGPGGNFVAEDHTVDHMLDEFFYPNLRVRCNFDVWEEAGRPDMLSRANELARKILRQGEEGLLDMDVIDEIKTAFPDSHYI